MSRIEFLTSAREACPSVDIDKKAFRFVGALDPLHEFGFDPPRSFRAVWRPEGRLDPDPNPFARVFQDLKFKSRVNLEWIAIPPLDRDFPGIRINDDVFTIDKGQR